MSENQKKNKEIVFEFKKLDKKTLFKIGHYVILAALIVWGFLLRMNPAKNIQYVQALDPYFISRLSGSIVKNGILPAFDFLRYVPFPSPTSFEHLGMEFLPSYLFKILSPIFSWTFADWVKISPAIGGALMILAAYLISREAFNKHSGLLAAFFMAFSAGVLHRSSSGWYDKEFLAGPLMMFSLYFFILGWKKKNWIPSVLGGIFLGVSTIVWGGTQLMYIVFSLAAFITLLLDRDTEKLFVAFTPLILIGNLIPFFFNPARWALTNSLVLLSIGTLGLVWIKYFINVLDIKFNKKLIIPLIVGIVLVLGFLSPLYSQSIASKFYGVISTVTQSGSKGVLSGTVAENAPSGLGQIVSQLGSVHATSVYPFLDGYTGYFSGWTFSLIGASIMILMFLISLYNDWFKKNLRETKIFPWLCLVSLIAVTLILISSFQGSGLLRLFGPAFILVFVWAILTYVKGEKEISSNYYILPLIVWVVGTVYASVLFARAIFLAAPAVAVSASFGFYFLFSRLRESVVFEKLSNLLGKDFRPSQIFATVLVLFLIPVVVVNATSADVMSKNIGGSPDQFWVESLEWIRINTPPDSVLYSWWDYGYWFQSIANRGSTADGGNSGFYALEGDDTPLVNFDLADFLTSNNYTEWMPWLKAYGVDYVVLDYSMIGKYTAVTQFQFRDNNKFKMMNTMDFEQVVNNNNQQYLSYCFKQGQSCIFGSAKIFIPVVVNGSSVTFTGAPIFQDGSGNIGRFDKFCTPNGVLQFENITNPIPGCPHIDPLAGTNRIVIVSRNQNGQFIGDDVDATLVKLYLRDGNEMPEFEKVFDNRFVKIWKVNYPEWVNEELERIRNQNSG